MEVIIEDHGTKELGAKQLMASDYVLFRLPVMENGQLFIGLPLYHFAQTFLVAFRPIISILNKDRNEDGKIAVHIINGITTKIYEETQMSDHVSK